MLDFHSAYARYMVLIFVDDTKFIHCIKFNFDVDQLQDDIDALTECMKQAVASVFNISRCKHLQIGTGS